PIPAKILRVAIDPPRGNENAGSPHSRRWGFHERGEQSSVGSIRPLLPQSASTFGKRSRIRVGEGMKRSLGMRNKPYSRGRALTGKLPLWASVIAALAIAALPTEALAGEWAEQGPAPILHVANLPPNGEVAGAINVIVPDPINPYVVFVGTVSG